MPAPAIDKAAWASLVEALVQQETAGNRTAFAGQIGVDRKTVGRWLAGTVGVSEESVRTVARKLGIAPRDLLVRVGYYSSADLENDEAAARQIAEDDKALQIIRESDAPPSLKRQLMAHVERQRAEHERQLADEVEMMLALARRGGKRAG